MNKLFLPLLLAFILSAHAVFSQINIDTATAVKNNRQLYSIVVSQNNKVIFNHYYNGKKTTDLYNNQSLTKSVMSLLIGIAIDKGYIRSVDERLVKYFPELANDTDKRKQQITIRQVMNQASGLWHEDLTRLDKYLALPNPSGYVLHQPLVSEPGKVFHYNNAATHILSVILTKACGHSTLQFANKYLFGPMDIKDVVWGKMKDGYHDGCGLLSVQLHTAEMNKLSTLLLHNGDYQGKNIVSSKWIDQLLHPTIFYKTPWGFEGSTYALCFYHFEYKGVPITYGLGWGGQFTFVIPSKKAVITVNESIDDATAIKASIVFLDRIFPVIYNELNRN
ncbi:serine hydrolase [Mucilaginibacter sp. L3T2-6]|uniref:serine hydrolase domain-containing protein n=1 Tax=Mucilaginibacter sp. L3T2-6 TaxID=3062491 RepID=UPI0026767272|nr:serine hydrolase [Mucilaginibacter sp. L3T2-6]MDO3641706.1 serine hydrolase [Mucilaginibacter sp. L3T2-6]MDV6214200.1 serine hydrolase [Mucilaginibacter sp. L3T2-6]